MFMRRHLRLIPFALLLASLVLATNVSAQVKLEPKLTPGDTIKSKDTIKASQSLNIAGQNLDSKSDSTMHHSLKVEDAGGGLLKVSMQFESIVSRVDLPGNQVLEIDSTKPAVDVEEEPAKKAMRELLTAMIGQKVQITIGPSRKVVLVEGVTENMPVTADEVKADFQQRMDLLPDQAIKPGDTWERTEQLHIGAGQTLAFQRKYEYAGTEKSAEAGKELDLIKGTDLSVLFTIRQNPQLPLVVKKSDLKIGSSAYNLYFDRGLGRVVKADGKSHIQGEIVFAVGGMELPGTIDLLIESISEEVK